MQHFAGALQVARAHQRFGIGREERRVALRGGKWLQNRDGANRVSALQIGLRVEQRHAALLRRQLLRAAQKIHRIGGRTLGRGQLSRAQERACRQRILSEALCALCQLDLPRQVVWLEPSDPLPTKQRVIVAPRRYEKLAGLVVLLDRFVRSILPLQQEGVARNALGGLLCRNGTKKPVVDGQRFAFILRIDQQIKQHAVIHGSAVGLVDARIEITQGLRRFLMLGCFPEHREIRFDGILDTILLKEALRAIQMLVDVCGHSFEMPLRFLKAA